MHRSVGRGAFLAAILLAAPLLAAPPGRSARLAYTRGRGADQCPGERAFRDAVEARLGYDPWSDAAPRSIAVTVQQAGGALRGDVTMTDAAGAVTGRRQLTAAGDDCDELVRAMALAVSIAIDPDVVFRPVPPSPAPAPSPPPSPPPAPAGTVPPASAPPAPPPRSGLPPPSIVAAPLPAAVAPPPPPSPLRWHAGAAGYVGSGTSPGVTGGVEVMAGFRWAAFSATLEGRADVPTTAAAPGGGTVRGGLLAANVVPCFHLGPVSACALGTFGAIRGVGSGVANARSDATPFAALGARLGGEIPFGRTFSAAVHGDLSAALTPTTLSLDGRGVWTTPRASASLGLGCVAHFP